MNEPTQNAEGNLSSESSEISSYYFDANLERKLDFLKPRLESILKDLNRLYVSWSTGEFVLPEAMPRCDQFR